MAFELEVLAKKVDRFGWDRDRNTPAQDRLVMDWMDALSDFTLEEVRSACRQAILDNPNKCPNEGHVQRIISAERRSTLALIKASKPYEPPPERERQPLSEETRSKIIEEVGFNPALFGLKKFGGEP